MNFHAGTLDDHPATRARRNLYSRELAIYLMTPGFSVAYHAHALDLSTTTINKHLAWSRQLVGADPTIADDIVMNAASITPEDGLKMAQRRGPAHLPWWSRLSIAEFATHLTTSDVASLFRCSRRTVQLVLTRGVLSYDAFTGIRRLSSSQVSPPGKWQGTRRAIFIASD